MLIGDYNNAQVDETNITSFFEKYELRSSHEPTCYKNPLNSSCIDLLLTNNVNNFQKTFFSDFFIYLYFLYC